MRINSIRIVSKTYRSAPAGLAIRPYRAPDLDAVIALFQAAVRESAARDYTPAEITAWAEVDRARWAVRRLDRPTWLALLDGMPAGFADLKPGGHLDMMYVHPAQQGRGVATALLACVEAAARDQGLAGIVTEASLTARPFFERRGFQVLGMQRVPLRGQVLVNVRMEKRLDPDSAGSSRIQPEEGFGL
jgi:putative acetyltransferase